MDKSTQAFIEQTIQEQTEEIARMLSRAFETVATKTDVQELGKRVGALEQDMASVKKTVEHTDGVVTRLENELIDDLKILREDHLTTKQRVTRLEKHLKLPRFTAADVEI